VGRRRIPTLTVVGSTRLHVHGFHRCADTWGHIVQPDGYGRWRDHDREIDFFLEYDGGTEPLNRLVDKLDAYTELAAPTGADRRLAGPHPLRVARARLLLGRALPRGYGDVAASDGYPLTVGVSRARNAPGFARAERTSCISTANSRLPRILANWSTAAGYFPTPTVGSSHSPPAS